MKPTRLVNAINTEIIDKSIVVFLDISAVNIKYVSIEGDIIEQTTNIVDEIFEGL